MLLFALICYILFPTITMSAIVKFTCLVIITYVCYLIVIN